MRRFPTLDEIQYLVQCVVHNAPLALSSYMETLRQYYDTQLDLNVIIRPAVDATGTTLLHLALVHDNPVMLVQYLLYYGMHHDLQDEQGQIIDVIIARISNHEVRDALIEVINPLPEISFITPYANEDETNAIGGCDNCTSGCD